MEGATSSLTQTVYQLILKENYVDAIATLESLLDSQPRNRAGLSLLGYCLFQTQDFITAITVYGTLATELPENADYRFALAQCLFMTDNFEEAMTEVCRIDIDVNPLMNEKVLQLKASIKYASEEFKEAQSFVNQCDTNAHAGTETNLGCIEYKMGNFDKALEHFDKAAGIVLEDDPRIWYNLAVTYFRANEYDAAISYIMEILKKANEEHPEFGIAHICDELPICSSVGNTSSLYKSAIVEALNLRAAIEYQSSRKVKNCMQILQRLPLREEHELDAVSLHNSAIFQFETDPSGSIQKLQFLLDQGTFPAETFSNFLSLLAKYEKYEDIADIMTANECYMHLVDPVEWRMYEYLVLRESSPETALVALEDITNEFEKRMRKMRKDSDDLHDSNKKDECDKICREFFHTVRNYYLPALMTQGKVYWDLENYAGLECLLSKGAEFCHNIDSWMLNMAHVHFMQGNYLQAIPLYENVTRSKIERMEMFVDVSAIVLANLCACYVLTLNHHEAERLLSRIQQNEILQSKEDPTEKYFHSCIAQLVLATVYAVKGPRFDIAVETIMRAMNPLDTRLGIDTWFFIKNVFLSLLKDMTLEKVQVKRNVLNTCVAFLKDCEKYGTNIQTVLDEETKNVELGNAAASLEFGKSTVSYEARVLRHLFLRQLDSYIEFNKIPIN